MNEEEIQHDHRGPEEEGVGLDVTDLKDAEESSCSHRTQRGEANEKRIDHETVDDVENGGNGILEDTDEALVDLVEVETIREEWNIDRIAVSSPIDEDRSGDTYRETD